MWIGSATHLGNDSPWQELTIGGVSPAAWPAAATQKRTPEARNVPAAPGGLRAHRILEALERWRESFSLRDR